MFPLPSFRSAIALPARGFRNATRARPPVERAPVRPTRTRISATILTRDSSRRIADVLAALAWCDEVIVLDTGSTDTTVAIASGFANARIHALEDGFKGFGHAHQQACRLARNDWILSIDSDEVVSIELIAEIADLHLCPRTVYTIPFHNHFNGRLIRSCGWHPDRHERLFNRKTTDFCASEVHEKVQTRGLVVRGLRHPVHHYSYDNADDFLRKMRAYGQLFAAQNVGRKRAGPGKAVRSGLWAFFKSYLLQRGFLEGYEGLVISVYKAQTAFWKYLLLHEANRNA